MFGTYVHMQHLEYLESLEQCNKSKFRTWCNLELYDGHYENEHDVSISYIKAHGTPNLVNFVTSSTTTTYSLLFFSP